MAVYNAAYVAAYHNQVAAELRPAAATLQYGGCQCRIVVVTTLYCGGCQGQIVVAANVEERWPPNVQFIAVQYLMSSLNKLNDTGYSINK